MFEKFKKSYNKKYLYFFIATILFSIVVLSIQPLLNYFEKKEVVSILNLMNNEDKNKSECEKILKFDKGNVSKGNTYFNESLFDNIFSDCEQKYDLSVVELNSNNCETIIKQTDQYFKEKYILFDNLENQRFECNNKFLKPTFEVGDFFDVNNNFKSKININFKLDFFTDIGLEGSDEYILNRTEAKQRLIDLIDITPKVEIGIDDIVLYKNKAIISYPLDPTTEYKINLASFNTSIGEQTDVSVLDFTTPENTYFGLDIQNPLSLYSENNLPKFDIIDYNTSITTANIQICNISESLYAKLEVFNEGKGKNFKDDFINKALSESSAISCYTKSIDFKNAEDINKNKLTKKEFSFSDIVDNNLNGLYSVSLIGDEQLKYNGEVNNPILFGVINSHIMMKVSKSGEGFFFINDFDGNPLPNQKIYAYVNDLKTKETNYNRENKEYDVTYNSLDEIEVFGTGIYLGETGNDGILKVALNDKIDDYFHKTFDQSRGRDRDGLYDSFFVKSFGDNNLSYLTSTWNAGIEPWNFGYSTWHWSDSNIRLDERGREKEYFSHIYTDRALYLPGETVFIKGVIRGSTKLDIPLNTDFRLEVKNQKREEILNKTINVNDFGSFSESLDLSEDYGLGTYNIFLYKGDSLLYNSGFTVEVFKNPKFHNDVSLKAVGLNNEFIKITDTKIEKKTYYDKVTYKGDFKIKANVNSTYFNGGTVKNATFEYKVYKQRYYGNKYWDSCYYGCYYEPSKEFYTKGQGKIDENGKSDFDINIDFESTYSDYKYIVEVTVKDEAGDTITGSNSVIVKLPDEYKKYNNDLSVDFTADEKFAKTGDSVKITGGLNIGEWTSDYNDKYFFIIKTKDFLNKVVTDANGYKRNIKSIQENIEKVFYVNDTNFTKNAEGRLELNYKLDKNTEYVFEYGKVKSYKVADYYGQKESDGLTIDQINEVMNKFNTTTKSYLEYYEEVSDCKKYSSFVDRRCLEKGTKIVTRRLYLNDFISLRNNFSVITYSDKDSKNPIENDNKLRVISDKISYHLGEKAKVLIRLPVSNSKILWTVEKNGIIKSEYIDVVGNTFFKEFDIDDTFAPNAYIGVMMVDTNKQNVPEYKVGYTEIVVDKTDKKSFIDIKSDKKTYQPRDEVSLDFDVKDKSGNPVKSELTVMVVDDSLISLMGNVDLNTLEKIYKKLPFLVQTSITNIAMLKNYYFSRRGIAGGSGYGNFKGGDSAVSTRNIFKNTAYFNPSVITDENGKASVKFTLPDNLTNFRIMAVGNSVNNFFGYSSENIEVRKNVIVEDKTPIILRDGDNSIVGANVFNNTENDIDFKVSLKADGVEIEQPDKNITIKANENTFVSWNIFANKGLDKITYTISALGDSSHNSDKIENTISIKQSPTLILNNIKTGIVKGNSKLDLNTLIGNNTDKDNSEVELTFSNNKLSGIDKIITSLAKYPYGCIEQTTSSTLPNVILKEYGNFFTGISEGEDLDKNINYGLSRIKSMQRSDGGFAFWQSDTESNLRITPYVLRSLIYMKDSGQDIPESLINNAVTYLENNLSSLETDDLSTKTEIFWSLEAAGKKSDITFDVSTLSRHELIAYTYGLILAKRPNKKLIESNIELIIQKFKGNESGSRYWNETGDKAIFTSLLLDFNDEKYNEEIEKLISDLYEYDWSSYYYSTKSKNNTFIAFYKYLSIKGVNNTSDFYFKIGNLNDNEKHIIGGDSNNFEKYNYNLNDILAGENLDLQVSNKSDTDIYVDYEIKEYPLDKIKVPEYSNGMNIDRKIYKVLDDTLLQKCSSTYYGNKKIDCSGVLSENTDNILEKGSLYKAKITVDFEDSKERNNLTIEDYLPGTFSVINTKFKTNSSAITDSTKSRRWDYTELSPDVIMATSKNVWGKKIVFEYYFRPEFKGTYTYPPVSGYMMYNPKVRASGKFSLIEVK